MNISPLCWGVKVSKPFRDRVRSLCYSLGMNPDHLMTCMHFETGGTFSPSIRNAAGSQAVGLIQFMPSTALALGTTDDKLEEMSALAQLEYVGDYFRNVSHRCKTVQDVYMAILWPSAIGKPESHVCFWEMKTLRNFYHAKLDPMANLPMQLRGLTEFQWKKLLSAPSARYVQNAGLDYNKDGMITKGEACARVTRLLIEGLKEENVAI